jgi:hypothetical protein
MNSTYVIAIAVAFLLVFGIVIGLVYSGRANRSKKMQEHYGPEYDHVVQTTGSAKAAEAELQQRNKHVEGLNIRPLTLPEHDRYLVEWKEVQAKFVDDPAQAIKEADRLIMEVMQLRAYPVSDFEARAADISVAYPELVTNYRAAHAIALKNEQNTANTEELRQAMVYDKSLFNELVVTEKPLEMEKVQ